MVRTKIKLSDRKKCTYATKRKIQGNKPTKKRLKTYKPPKSHSPTTSAEFDDETGKFSDDKDEIMDCDSNEDLQYAIFMDAQARLEAAGLGDFLSKLCLLIRSESLTFGNICFRLFVDMVNFLSVDDARTFRYQSQTLVWWYVLLKQHGELILRTCGGLKFLGIMGDESNTQMKPTSAKINFVVPSPSILRSLRPTELDVSSQKSPGVFHDVLNIIEKNPEKCYNLQFDGKLLKPGLTDKYGDIDCLNEEPPPTLSDRKTQHQLNNTILDKTQDLFTVAARQSTETQGIPYPMLPAIGDGCRSVHQLMCDTVKSLRDLKQQKLRAIEKFKKKGGEKWRQSKYQYVIDSCQTTIHITVDTLRKTNEILDRNTYLQAYSNGAKELYRSGSVHLPSMQNYRELRSPMDIEQQGIYLLPQITKQRSDEWFSIRQGVRITGSKLAQAVGVMGIGEMREVFDAVSDVITSSDTRVINNQLFL